MILTRAQCIKIYLWSSEQWLRFTHSTQCVTISSCVMQGIHRTHSFICSFFLHLRELFVLFACCEFICGGDIDAWTPAYMASGVVRDLTSGRQLVKNKNEQRQTNRSEATTRHANKVLSVRETPESTAWFYTQTSLYCLTTSVGCATTQVVCEQVPVCAAVMHWHWQWTCEISCKIYCGTATIHLWNYMIFPAELWHVTCHFWCTAYRQMLQTLS